MESTSPTLTTTTEESTIDASKIIVIHCGSLFVRIGRASDSSPITLYNVIARRNKSNKIASQEDPFLIPAVKIDKELNKTLLESQNNVINTLNSCLTSNGKSRTVTAKEKLIEYNRRTKAILMPKNSDNVRQWSQTSNRDVIIGEEVLTLKPTEPYHIRWPIRRFILIL